MREQVTANAHYLYVRAGTRMLLKVEPLASAIHADELVYTFDKVRD